MRRICRILCENPSRSKYINGLQHIFRGPFQECIQKRSVSHQRSKVLLDSDGHKNSVGSSMRHSVIPPNATKLKWERPPKNILLIRQLYNKRINDHVLWITKYLIENKECNVFVERHVLKDLRRWKRNLSLFLSPTSSTLSSPTLSSQQRQLRNEGLQTGEKEENIGNIGSNKNIEEMEYHDMKNRFKLLTQILKNERFKAFEKTDKLKLEEMTDMVVCLGGDGTILHTAQQFQSIVPPILGFNFSSIGFLTNFEMNSYRDIIDHVFSGQSFLSVRMRLDCKIQRKDGKIDEISYQVLNEVAIDRGPSPYLTSLECYCSNTLITSVQADGLIIATPTGSTAYSMSAGGSIVHPGVPCILLTPISPHSLSFRPLILPDSTVLKIKLPLNARYSAWVSFDGKNRQEIQKGDSIVVTASQYPVPLISEQDTTQGTSEWFLNLTRCLHWNVRKPQKPFEEHSEPHLSSANHHHHNHHLNPSLLEAPSTCRNDHDDEEG